MAKIIKKIVKLKFKMILTSENDMKNGKKRNPRVFIMKLGKKN